MLEYSPFDDDSEVGHGESRDGVGRRVPVRGEGVEYVANQSGPLIAIEDCRSANAARIVLMLFESLILVLSRSLVEPQDIVSDREWDEGLAIFAQYEASAMTVFASRAWFQKLLA
jgi:hypothetical protein